MRRALPLETCRLVLDTQIWLDLIVFEDARCGGLAEALSQGRVRAIVRGDTWDEWQRVLRYPALGLDEARISLATDRSRAWATTVEDADCRPAPALPRCRDPEDQMFLEVAAESRAHVLLSRDKALLELDRRLQRAGLFRVLTPEGWTTISSAAPDGSPLAQPAGASSQST